MVDMTFESDKVGLGLHQADLVLLFSSLARVFLRWARVKVSIEFEKTKQKKKKK